MFKVRNLVIASTLLLYISTAALAIATVAVPKVTEAAMCTTYRCSGSGLFACSFCKGTNVQNGFTCTFCNGKGKERVLADIVEVRLVKK